MSSAPALRLQIETALAARIPGALTPRPRTIREVATTGVAALDEVLEGGFPIGALTEMVGPQSCGRTTLAMSAMAEMTQAGKTVAWVDTSDALDPESAAASGVALQRQLWVRCGQDPQAAKARSLPPAPPPNRGAALLAEDRRTPAPSGGCGSPHPRSEVRGLSQAVDAFLQSDVFSRPAPPRDPAVSRRNYIVSRIGAPGRPGTPGAANRKLTDVEPQDARPFPRRARDREEQIPTDRQPSRRQMMNAVAYKTARRETLQSAQLANTVQAAAARPQASSWQNNSQNANGRSLATPPNSIAAGLPRFREMEARAAGQGHEPAAEPGSSKPVLRSFGPKKDEAQAQAAPVPPHLRYNRPPLPFTPRGEGQKALLSAVQATLDRSRKQQQAEASLAGEPPRPGKRPSPLWRALDQALRATDLLLAAGGFSAIVLDLGSIPAEFAWRIPLATWFRFRAAADRARTVLLVLTSHPCARFSAELVLRLRPLEAVDASTVFTGAALHVSIDRRRFESHGGGPDVHKSPEPVRSLHLVPAKKQPGRVREATWKRAAAWTGTGPLLTGSIPSDPARPAGSAAGRNTQTGKLS